MIQIWIDLRTFHSSSASLIDLQQVLSNAPSISKTPKEYSLASSAFQSYKQDGEVHFSSPCLLEVHADEMYGNRGPLLKYLSTGFSNSFSRKNVRLIGL